jgi:hypothetical protein
MGRPLLVRGASAFAGDFALFFGRHRSEAAAFLALSSSHRSDLPFVVPIE